MKNPEPNFKRVRPILRWPGGKSRLLKEILPLIPEHVCYCEPCGGSLAVFLAKPRSTVEVVNDLNGDLVALYRNLQFHLPELLREMEWLFSSRKNLKDFVQQPGLTEIQRAARFLLKNRTSFAGNMKNFGVVRTAGGGATFYRAKQQEMIGALHKRLDNVAVENLPYDRCVKLYDSPQTFFFLDPPYVNAPTGAYDGWTQKQMSDFREQLRGLQGKWLATINDSEENRELFSDCQVKRIRTRNRLVNNRAAKQDFGELIITPS